MIVLKDYQERVLDSLRLFFQQCSKDGRPEAAFQRIQEYNGNNIFRYLPVGAAGLAPDMPYVCLRVPTGGGKTLLACYAVGLATHELLHAEQGIVLWLVPSNTILDQTTDALRNPRHPYRRALELACGSVEVVTITEALNLSRATVEGQTVVIVATIQSFRVEDTTGRKVYDQNGVFSEHLQDLLSETSERLLPGADGKPKPSLVNMLRLRRPIVIVDEAHNARTDLSFSTLGNMMPSCIIEFTATPDRTRNPSNVLHRVSAAELKAADMIKLPLRVMTRHPSQRDQLLAEAITLRSDLEKVAEIEAQETSEYLRPILLIQSERVDDCEPLRDRMVREFGLSREQIVISTGRIDELKRIRDISSPKCPVRFIITVEKLREGWDCPFAYVLCSLKDTRSATAIEQIVGRILRLPQAQAKQHPDLNCAYAFSVSESLPEVLNELREALERNGFTTAEADRIVMPVSQGYLPLGLQPRTVVMEPGQIDTDIASVQINALAGKVGFDLEKYQITVFVPLDKADTEKLTSCVITPEAKLKIQEAVEQVRETDKAFLGTGQPRTLSPYEQHLEFSMPLLCINEEGTLVEFESTFFLEHPWKLSAKDASLSENYNPLERPMGKLGQVDVSGTGKVETMVSESPREDFIADLHRDMFKLGGATEWTFETLVAWLDRKIGHQDIPLGESAAFITKALRSLMAKHGITDISMLALDRFRLRDEIEARIQQHRLSERKAAFQHYLEPDSSLLVSQEFSINFMTSSYEPSWLYEGNYQFQKHYFGKPGELRERTESGELTEEFSCAQYIDSLANVKYWIRNIPRKRNSFRLHTSKDWFYPDFVCLLYDGRVLAVEYKGGHLYETADAAEKRAVGAVWASRSNGRCLFAMPTGNDYQAIINMLI